MDITFLQFDSLNFYLSKYSDDKVSK
jgi:hypothetical protein